MRPHWGHVTATVGSGFLSLRAWRLRSRSCKRFFSNAWTPLRTPSSHAQRSTARVSQFDVDRPQAPKDAFRQSLNLLSGCPVFRVPEASSEKKIIFGRRVSSIRTTCPTHLNCALMMSASTPGMLALCSTSVLGTLSSQEIPMILRRHRR